MNDTNASTKQSAKQDSQIPVASTQPAPDIAGSFTLADTTQESETHPQQSSIQSEVQSDNLESLMNPQAPSIQTESFVDVPPVLSNEQTPPAPEVMNTPPIMAPAQPIQNEGNIDTLSQQPLNTDLITAPSTPNPDLHVNNEASPLNTTEPPQETQAINQLPPEEPVEAPVVGSNAETTIYGAPPSTEKETIVVPPQEPAPSFVPQGLVNDTGTSTNGNIPPQKTAPPKKRGFLKWIIILFILLLVAGLGFVLFNFGRQYVSDNQEVTLQYWGLWEDESIVKPIIEKFQQEYPNIKVQYSNQNITEYKDRVQSAIQRGDGPDVFQFHATWIPMLRDEIEPIPDTVVSPSEFTSTYYDVMQRDLLAGSTLWGIPMMSEGLGLYVNEDLFASAGVSVPKTYEELLAVVPQLTVKNEDQIVTSAIALGTTNNVEHFSDILALMIMQNGGQLTNPVGIESEEALLFFLKFSNPSDPVYTWNGLQDNSVSAFANGRVAMMLAPSWRAFDVAQLNPNLRFHIEPVPQLSPSPLTWSSYWVDGVSSQSKYKDQAFEFLKFFTNEENTQLLYAEAAKTRLFGPPYARKNLGSQLLSDPFAGAYIEEIPYARSFPLSSNTYDNGLNDEMIQYMEIAINSVAAGASPSEALSAMAQGFQDVLSKYGLATNQQSQ